MLFFIVVDGNGAGFGNLEIIVNGGKVTSHVSTVEPQKKFSANFIPHEAGRHRIDVKFNGEKIGSPRFVEVNFQPSTITFAQLLNFFPKHNSDKSKFECNITFFPGQGSKHTPYGSRTANRKN